MVIQEMELLQKAKESFYAKRVQQEARVKEIATVIEPIRNTVLAGVNVPEEFTLQNLLPELYADRVNVDVYKEQLKVFKELLSVIKSRIIEANAKSVRELENYCEGIDPNLTDAQKLAKIREKFITDRAKQEQVVTNLAEGLKNVDPALLEGIGLPAELTLQALVPEYYATDLNPEKCREQYDAAMEILQRLNDFVQEKNKEARECLLNYQALASGPQSID